MFHKDGDYAAFLKLLKQASDRIPMRLLAFCLMPNHFHLVVWTRQEGDLSQWMQWLTTSHVVATIDTTIHPGNKRGNKRGQATYLEM